MPRTTLLSIFAGLALVATGCGGGSKAQSDAGVQEDAHQFDANHGDAQHDAAPDGPGGFEGAKTITIDSSTYTTGTLSNPLTSKDYYKFNGTAGQRIAVATIAKGEQDDPFDPTYLDLVVTIYDSTETAIATQDDPWPRESNDPQLFTVLPSTGLFYVTVEECNQAFGADSCAPASAITHKSYQIGLFTVDNLGPPVPVLEGTSDQDGTTGNAIPVTFTSSQTIDAGVGGNLYMRDIIGGGFQSGTDVDVFSFKMPADYLILEDTYRPTAVLYLQTPGLTNGDGSTAQMRVWLTDSDGVTKLAELDQANYGDTADITNGPAELNVPITLDHQYYLFVENREGAAGARDFYYIMRADDNYFGPNETQDTANNTLATAEVMPTQKDADGSDWYGVSGDISPAGTDVDYYSMAVNTGMTLANISCEAQRIGSGLRGFKFTLLKSDGSAITNGTLTEAADSEMRITDLAIPGGATTVILKLEAASQDANVTGTNYRCQVHLHS